jgi:hypothetical protein
MTANIGTSEAVEKSSTNSCSKSEAAAPALPAANSAVAAADRTSIVKAATKKA